MGEDLDPQVVHHPGGQAARHLDLQPLGHGGDGDEDQVGGGQDGDDGEVLVPRRHPVVDGDPGELGAGLGGDRDDHDQQAGQGQHAPVLGQEAPQGEALQLELGAVLVEDDVRCGMLGL